MKPMNTDRKKELQEAYRNRRPEMGVVALRCLATEETFLGTTRDTKAEFNSLRAKLDGGRHPNKHLQELWNIYNAEGFEMFVSQTLKYESPNDVTAEDLEELRELCLAENPQASKIWK